MLVSVGIALGSNLGDRSAELDAGVSFLRYICAGPKLMLSPRIETEPVDCPPDSPPFLNCAVEIQVDTVMMTPLNLIASLKEFEIIRGRNPLNPRHAPRTLDMDIIYYGVERFDVMGLIVPHPRAHERRFVLEPLAHLRPDLVLPGQTRSVKQLLAALPK